MDETKTSDHIQINIMVQNPSQEPPASSKAPHDDLKDMDVLCIFKIKVEPIFRTGDYQRQQLFINQYQDAKLQSGTYRVL